MKQVDDEQIRINEEHCLGVILVNPEVIPSVIPILGDDASCFSLSMNKVIYESIMALYQENKVIDAYTIAVHINTTYPNTIVTHMKDAYEKVLWLHDTTPNASVDIAADYASIVSNNSKRMKLSNIGKEIQRLADNVEHETDDIVSESISQLTNLSFDFNNKEFSLPNTLETIETNMQLAINGEEPGDRRYTGLPSLDLTANGIVYGEITIIAGRTTVGKSTLAQAIVRYQAIEKEYPTILFLLEMTETQYMLRMVSSITGIPSLDMVKGDVTPAQVEQFKECKEQLKNKPLYINTKSKTAKQMALQTQKFMHTHNTDECLVVTDYAQLMEAGNNLSDYENTTRSMKSLKNEVAVNLNLPVLLVSQLNRRSEYGNRRASIADLRSSGALEEGGGQVLLIHKQPELSEDEGVFSSALAQNNHKDWREMEVEIAKNRLGQDKGIAILKFEPHINRVSEM